jgi:hypothetical protein
MRVTVRLKPESYLCNKPQEVFHTEVLYTQYGNSFFSVVGPRFTTRYNTERVLEVTEHKL